MRDVADHRNDQWLPGFREGRETSFSAIFEALYPGLCYYALTYTKDQAAAEDIAEEAFLVVWNTRQIFFQWPVLKSYLYTTVRHAAINWTKRQQRRWAYESEIAAASPENDKYVLEDLIRAELLREIYTAMDTLPSQCRKVISMLFLDGKSTRQIAEELDLSLTTVKSQKARGLMLLRKRLPQLLLLLLNGIQLIWTSL